MPPDLPINLDDSPIRQFQFVARESLSVQDEIAQLQSRVGMLPENAPVEPIGGILDELSDLLEPIGRHIDGVREDLDTMDEAIPAREQALEEEDIEAFRIERTQLRDRLATVMQESQQAGRTLDGLKQQLSADARDAGDPRRRGAAR